MTYTISGFLGIQILFFLSCLIKDKKIKKVIFTGLVFLFAIYLGMRSLDIGYDTYNYAIAYLSGTGGYFQEILFKKIGYLIYYMKFDLNGYFIIISLLNTFFYYQGYKLNFKNNTQFYLAFWLLLFNTTYLYGSINILRQSLAHGIFLISLYYLKKAKIKKFIFLIFIGCGFHISVIFWSGLPILKKYYFKILRKRKFLIFILSVVVSKICIRVLLFIPKFYIYYYFQKSNKSMYIKLILLVVLFILGLKFKKISRFDEVVLFYAILLLCFFIDFPLLSGRLIYFISAYLPMVFVNSLRNNKKLLIALGWLYHVVVLFYPSTIGLFKF